MFSAEQLADIRAMITAGGTPLGAEAMDMLPKLGAIVCYGTGYDGVDLAAAAEAQDRGRPQPGRECGLGRRYRGDADAGGDAAAAGGRRLCAQRRLGGGKTVADDAPAGRHARPQDRRLRHGRDRPQDRRARRGLRDRGRLFQPQPARRAVSIFSEPRGAGGMVQRADDRGSRRRRHPSRRQCRYPEASSARTAMSSTSRAAR